MSAFRERSIRRSRFPRTGHTHATTLIDELSCRFRSTSEERIVNESVIAATLAEDRRHKEGIVRRILAGKRKP